MTFISFSDWLLYAEIFYTIGSRYSFHLKYTLVSMNKNKTVTKIAMQYLCETEIRLQEVLLTTDQGHNYTLDAYPVAFALSLPAKSTRWILLTVSYGRPCMNPAFTNVMVKMAWLRLKQN